MDSEIFRAGVRPGGPTSLEEIKMLICYMLAELKAPMRFDQIHEVMEEKELVNYFELVRAMDEMEKSGHLALGDAEGVTVYFATKLGMETAEIFKKSLPLTVRERAVSGALLLLRRQRRLAELVVEVEPVASGYQMRFAIPDEGGSLLSLSLFAATKQDCEQMRRRFLNDPVFIYRAVAALLTGDENVLEGILPEKEKLF
jgi:hypothetical protein